MKGRLSAGDMSNLFAERGPVHLHVGGTILVEGAPPDYEELISHVEERLDLVPRFRQRIVKIPFGIENPVWGDDSGFDVRRHVRNIAVPRPGRLDQLRDLVGRIMSEPLDMERPLWQLYISTGCAMVSYDGQVFIGLVGTATSSPTSTSWRPRSARSCASSRCRGGSRRSERLLPSGSSPRSGSRRAPAAANG